MSIRRSILWLGAAVAVLIVLLIWFAKKPAETTLPPAIETNAMPSPATEQITPKSSQRQTGPARHTNTPTVQAVPGGNIPAPPTQTKADTARLGLSVLNDVPIVFYGKLEDQLGNPVVGAVITGSTIIYNGVKTGGERVSITSDANGFFKIDAGKGESLGIMPQKEGYSLATTRTEFKYSYMYSEYFTPDANNPVVIKMWKLHRAEPLVGIGKEHKLTFTGKPLFFDLLTGQTSESGGDLQVFITRASGSLSKRNPGDWSIEFKPVNGGILESDEATSRVTYEAPAEGYQSSYLVQMNHENPAWFDNVQKVFFLTSRSGQVYSKLAVDFGINREPNGLIWIQFRGAANANGSRNWEATADTPKPQ